MLILWEIVESIGATPVSVVSFDSNLSFFIALCCVEFAAFELRCHCVVALVIMKSISKFPIVENVKQKVCPSIPLYLLVCFFFTFFER